MNNNPSEDKANVRIRKLETKSRKQSSKIYITRKLTMTHFRIPARPNFIGICSPQNRKEKWTCYQHPNLPSERETTALEAEQNKEEDLP